MSARGVVYVVQEPTRKDPVTGAMTRKFDLRPAAVYGSIQILLEPDEEMLSTGPIVHKLRRLLRDFSDDDHLLATGDPSAIAAAAAVCALVNHGRVRMLKWDKESRQYISVRVDVAGRPT